MKQSPPNPVQASDNHQAGAHDKGILRTTNSDSSEKWNQERRDGCSICGKKNCCADDHRFHGLLIGMGF